MTNVAHKQGASLAIAIALLSGQALAEANLPKLGADPQAVSVSGLSSGAYMATQLHVAYSARFMGAGLVAGGPYNCTLGRGFLETTPCLKNPHIGGPNVAAMVASAKDASNKNKIDSLDLLKPHKLYIFTGTNDNVVVPGIVEKTKDFYRGVDVSIENIKFVKELPAGHGFISPNANNGCAVTGSPYINKCAIKGDDKYYDQAGEILQQIYGPLNAPAVALSGNVLAFDQASYTTVKLKKLSLADKGHVYVPKACREADSQCKIHVSLHGCGQSEESIQDKWYTTLGLNNWADTNKIIVLYPQAQKSSVNPQNPYGCWDWWGYTGSDFAVKSAGQMRAIIAMVDALIQKE